VKTCQIHPGFRHQRRWFGDEVQGFEEHMSGAVSVPRDNGSSGITPSYTLADMW
jgi:hypothetical protein